MTESVCVGVSQRKAEPALEMEQQVINPPVNVLKPRASHAEAVESLLFSSHLFAKMATVDFPEAQKP